MEYESLLRKPIAQLPVYQPGRPIEDLAREIGCRPDHILKLASNENPFGASPRAQRLLKEEASNLALYPDNSGYRLTGALAERLGVENEQIILAAGSNEIFYRLCDLFVEPGVEVVMGAHAFISYKIATLLAGGVPVEVPMPDLVHDLKAMQAAITDRTRLVFLPNPNNPTGTHVSSAEVNSFISELPDHVTFCYDEAYCEYDTDPTDLVPWIRTGKKIVGTRTFSKLYGLAGLRIGYGYAEAGLANLLNRVRPPFNTSSIAQSCALAALDDTDWLDTCRLRNEEGLEQLGDGFKSLGITFWPSRGNFLLVQVENPAKVFEQLQMIGIIVRPVGGYGLSNHLRISVGTESQNARLLKELATLIKPA